LSPTTDSRGAGRRKAHVSDVLVALGGSPEEPEQPTGGADQDASLGSRLDAYTRLARNRSGPVLPPPAETEATAVVAKAIEPEAAPVAVAATAAAPVPGRRRRRLGVGSAVRRAAAGLVRAARALARALRHAVRVGARFLVRAAHGVGTGLVGARAALKRPEPPTEPEHVALGVSERVREWSSHENVVDFADEQLPARETDIAAF
jgi:hypothetical protein